MREVTISLSDDTYAIIEQRAKAESFEGVESFLNNLLRNMVEVRREGKLLWEWRVTGVTTSCHPFAYLREGLAERGILTCHEAMQRKAGVRVTIAGLNLRPHRPPSKSGGRHLFTTFEDETAYVQAAFYGRAVEACLPTILPSPVVIARAAVKRVGLGASLEVEKVWPLCVGQFMELPAKSSVSITVQR